MCDCDMLPQTKQELVIDEVVATSEHGAESHEAGHQHHRHAQVLLKRMDGHCDYTLMMVMASHLCQLGERHGGQHEHDAAPVGEHRRLGVGPAVGVLHGALYRAEGVPHHALEVLLRTGVLKLQEVTWWQASSPKRPRMYQRRV